MKQKSLSVWLKTITVGVGLLGALVYGVVLPMLGQETATANPEFAYCFWPWMIFLWVTGIPCCAALVLAWRIFSNIGKDGSFTAENAKYLKWISWLAAGDTAYFFLGNVGFTLASMTHPGILLYSFVVDFVGVCVAVVAAALSHLVQKAAALQEQSDLTI